MEEEKNINTNSTVTEEPENTKNVDVILPEVGMNVVISVLVNEVKVNYTNKTHDISGVIYAHNTESKVFCKGQGLEPKIKLDGQQAYFVLTGKITAEIKDVYETYYKVETKLNDQIVTYYMDADDFICQ